MTRRKRCWWLLGSTASALVLADLACATGPTREPVKEPVARREAPPPRRVVRERPRRPVRRAAPRRRSLQLTRAERGVVLAVVNGTSITQGEFHDRIHRQSVFTRRRYTSLARKKEYLEREFIMPLVEYAAAKKRGLAKDDQVERTRKNLMVSKLIRMLRKQLRPAEPAESKLRAYYQKHRADYNRPALVRVSQILVKTKALAKRVIREARGKSSVEFRRLVQRYSRDAATRRRAGDLRYFDRQGKLGLLYESTGRQVPRPLARAAFKLSTRGEVAGPIRTRRGWHVIRLTARRPARKRTFDQARLHVKKRLMRERWQARKQRYIERKKKFFGAKPVPKGVRDKRLRLVRVGPAKLPARVSRLVLARIGKDVITVGDLRARINRMSTHVRSRYRSLSKKRSLLESMVEFEVLARVAGSRGLARRPDVERMLRQVMIQRLRQVIGEKLLPASRLVGVSGTKQELLLEQRRTAVQTYLRRLRSSARVTIHEASLARVPIDLTLRRTHR